MKAVLTICTFLFLAVFQCAMASGPSQIVRYPIAPLSGSYYDPESSGTGWFIDVGRIRPDGTAFFFAANFTYVIDGQPTWVVLQGQFTPSTEVERQTAGIIGRANGPLYVGANGQCIGCAKKLATITESPLGNAEIVWRNTDRGDFTFNGVTTKLTRLVYGDAQSTQENGMVGRWRWVLTQDFTNGSGTFGREIQTGIVNIFRRAPANRYYFYSNDALPFSIADADTAEQYTLSCQVFSCPFGSKNGTSNQDPDFVSASSDAVLVRLPSGEWRVYGFVTSITRPDTVAGTPITRFLITATGASNFGTYISSATSDEFVVRQNLGSGQSPGISGEYLFRRVTDGTRPIEDFQ